MDETKLHRDKERGAQAEAFMRSEIVRDAFKTMEQQYVQAWAGSQVHDQEARENFYRAIQQLGDFKHHFESVLTNGRLAEAELTALAHRFRVA